MAQNQQNVSAQPTGGQYQQQGQGHWQAHLGECALNLTSPSTLTSFGDRGAIWAACAIAGDQPLGKNGPECDQRPGAADTISARPQMAPCFHRRAIRAAFCNAA